MTDALDGTVAIVTGGGGGIGRETAKVLVEHGARVVVADLSEDAGAATIDYVDGGGAAVFERADVADLESTQHLVAAAVEGYGRLGTAHDVAEMVAWLGSDAAAFATGSMYPIDGGYLAI